MIKKKEIVNSYSLATQEKKSIKRIIFTNRLTREQIRISVEKQSYKVFFFLRSICKHGGNMGVTEILNLHLRKEFSI